MTAEEEKFAEEARGLVELVRKRLPWDFAPIDDTEAWPLIGTGLLARQVGSIEAVYALLSLDREADANVLVRSLYEHVTTFVWLAADPGPERIRRWRKSDAIARLKADAECRDLGFPILEPEMKRTFEAAKDQLPAEMPGLRDRAIAADRHWEGKVTGFYGDDQPISLTGLYAFAYRRHSAIAHPSLMGLNAVTTHLDPVRRRVDLEQRDPEMRGPFGLARVVFALGLYVAGESLGWPEKAEVDEVLTD